MAIELNNICNKMGLTCFMIDTQLLIDPELINYLVVHDATNR